MAAPSVYKRLDLDVFLICLLAEGDTSGNDVKLYD